MSYGDIFNERMTVKMLHQHMHEYEPHPSSLLLRCRDCGYELASTKLLQGAYLHVDDVTCPIKLAITGAWKVDAKFLQPEKDPREDTIEGLLELMLEPGGLKK